MDDYARAVLLGLIQALTEFLPISSSAHLVLAPHLLGDDVSSLTFDVGLHLGTIAAVLGYFWRDWLRIISAGLRDITRHSTALERWEPDARLGLWIMVGTIPAVIVGGLFDGVIEDHLREPWLAASMLIAFSFVILALDRAGALIRRVADVRPADAIVVGLAQALALIPGVSRSGMTIAAARGLGFQRADAARFSFLLSAPAVVGAAALELTKAVRGDEVVAWRPMIVGMLVAAVAGALVIRWLLVFLQSHNLSVFVWYRIGLGVTVLLAVAAGWIE